MYMNWAIVQLLSIGVLSKHKEDIIVYIVLTLISKQHAQFRTPPELFEEKKLDLPLLKETTLILNPFQSTKKKKE